MYLCKSEWARIYGRVSEWLGFINCIHFQKNLLLSPRSSRRLSSSETPDSAFLGGIGEYENGFPEDTLSFKSWPFTFAVWSKDEVTPAVDCKSAKSASENKNQRELWRNN